LGEKLVYGLEVFMGYQRILDPKCVQTFERRRSQRKLVRDFMKVEEGGVHCNKYDGHCIKQ
jgi:hypothetical protein